MTHRRPLLFAVAALAACGDPPSADPMLVAEWTQRAVALGRAGHLPAPVAARMSAYAAVAVFEGHAADSRSGLRSLASQLNGLWSVPRADGVDGATVAAAAVRDVLDALGPPTDEARRGTESIAEAHVARRRSDGVGRKRSERSVAHGRVLARVILAWAATDGFAATRGRAWSQARTVARWSPPAAHAQAPSNGSIVLAGSPSGGAVEPHWGRLRAFVLRNGDECAPPAPPAYSESRGSDFWKMGRELADSLARSTPERRVAASFWHDDPLQAQAALTRAGQHVVRARSRVAADAAEAYALAAIAIADAYVGAWREKYRSMVVRPSAYMPRVFATAVSGAPEAASPEYPAEQAVIAAAAFTALQALLGDSTAFVDSGAGGTRRYGGFAAAGDEISMAPVYAGLQFLPAVVNGRAQGACIGQRVVNRLRTR